MAAGATVFARCHHCGAHAKFEIQPDLFDGEALIAERPCSMSPSGRCEPGSLARAVIERRKALGRALE